MNEEVKKPQETNEKHARNNDAKRPARVGRSFSLSLGLECESVHSVQIQGLAT